MTRAVLDTNVLVSALIVTYGKPAQIIGYASEGKFVLVISKEIIRETDVSLHRKHIQKRFHPSDDVIEAFLNKLRALGQFVEIRDLENVVPEDPPDNVIFACAVEGNAEYLVSGNRHLLKLDGYRGIKMVTPAHFLEILKRLADNSQGEEFV